MKRMSFGTQTKTHLFCGKDRLHFEVRYVIKYLAHLNDASVERVVKRENGRQTLELSLEAVDGKIILIEVISKSAGSICLKTGWKVNLKKYSQIYKKSSLNSVGNCCSVKHHAF